MPSIQILQWSLWGLSVLAGIGAVLALFKLRYAERFLPPWSELKDIEATLPVRRDELRQATEAIERCRAEIGQLEATVGNLRILKEWQNANPEAPARIQQMMVELERCKSELSAVQTRLAQDEARLLQVSQEANKLTQEKAELSEQVAAMRDRLAALSKQTAELEKTSRDLDDQRRQLEARITSLKIDVQSAEHRLDTVQKQLEKAEQERVTTERERKEAESARDAARTEKAQLDARVSELRDQLASFDKQKTKLEKTVRELEDQWRQLDTLLTGVKKEVQSNENMLAGLRQQVQQAEKERAKMERERREAEAARDAARAERAGLEKAVEQLRELAKGMQVNLERAGVTSSEPYKDLFAPIFSDSDGRRYLAASSRHQEEQEALERTRDFIRTKGLFFPQRVLYAFHTSLKANDISPLVVLAGISGTGKSELSRHYAYGMGLHFLLIAVQPRWDSPQDLFGFYNYLEKRYKATDLTRALVQFELFNQGCWKLPEGTEIDDRKDRMLLVLLDEMNLARTEYYFSEFLSKLETRRMVDEKDAMSRARAEVALDMGSLLEGGNSIRLYPGRNVLFAGTMNEDESTQALSDKVVDRACVLRFWRPKNTNPATGQAPCKPTENALTYTNWKKWLAKQNNLETVSGDIDGWIIRLNEALTELGRPFAFRVDKAIRTYVAHYPSWVPGWHRKAMADQIEQRILPKLRGVETELAQEPLQRIGAVVRELEDVPLEKAYSESWQNQPTFLFRGVSRDETE